MLQIAVGTALAMFVAGLLWASGLGCRLHLASGRIPPTAREVALLGALVTLWTSVVAGNAQEWVDYGIAWHWVYVAFALWALPFIFTVVLWQDSAARGDAFRPTQRRAVAWVCLLAAGAIVLVAGHFLFAAENPLLEVAGWWVFSGILGMVWAGRRVLWPGPRRQQD